MKLLLVASLVVLAGTAMAQTPPPPNKSGGAAALARGWVRNNFGVWSRRAEGPYHDAYMRRGCRVEEDWDGTQYTATVSCAPGVRPD